MSNYGSNENTRDENLGSIGLGTQVSIQNHKTENEQLLKDIEQRDHLFRAISEATTLLLLADVDEFENALFKSMGMMAQAVNADRVRLWKNHTEKGELYCTQLYEWSENVTPTQGSSITIAASYTQDLPGWEETLGKGQCINSIVRDRSLKEQERLVPQGIKSLLIVPVFLHDDFWGFVGFNDCHKERLFTANEESILWSGSFLITNALLRHEMTQNLATALEKAQAANEAKTNFLSNMSHEIRTPINAIVGMTAIGKASIDIDRKDYAFGKIEDASSHLLGVINDILDMSKIEANKFELSNTTFNFQKMLETAIDIVGFRLHEKTHNFSMTCDPNIPDRLIGDDQRLTQVITNILSNAIKFTPDMGTISMDLQLLKLDNDFCTIETSITDTGIGISQEQQNRLFTPFEQAESSTSRKYGGTGLGLAISKRIVELMEGDIWVNSTLGEGSTFSFTVRLECAPDEIIDQSEIQHEDAIQSFPDCHILLAEDVEINREIVQSLLEPMQITLDCAVNGLEAVNMYSIAPHKYDLVLMDLQMPEMDGYEATRTIRALDIPGAKDIPILAVTANVFREDVLKCFEAGMNDHIGKPINIDEIVTKLRKYIPHRK
ncbi:MAG: ATP-binding protein [Oscillospiraceae bacterium]|nr:ATP-binding protein [Oscillospiraceae bacterium]